MKGAMLLTPSDQTAKLYYGPSSFRVLRPGSHVLCAVSGEAIPLAELRYWSAERQEAYASPEMATRCLLGLV
jgi:hypothetical protein